MSNDLSSRQQRIIRDLQVSPEFDAASEARRRIDFLVAQMRNSRRHVLVLGISGGVDSSVAGRLAQLAVQQLREEGEPATFIAARLPYVEQHDEADARAALDFIQPDELLRVDIGPASDALLQATKDAGLAFRDAAHEDFVLGNIKARQRMIAQYAIAGARDGLVIGTDHAAEALMGFFTKHGDGACDVAPLYGLNKRRVRAVGRWLGAPEALTEKVPTADLESLRPGHADETALGVRYEEIDDFLEGKPVSEEASRIILRTYDNSAHKRALAVTP
ncbi:ammonia-dependent NAD(+) synthetase [Pseudomonas kuykendallii]|uniref:NH(3)-dependent NAD(+) synthetase n=1 Tax=Pseudomonas kuykendallii TaxID=1007099 RepID=A0A1H2ZNG0_9PSED|nr:ammonia-dependent NAD(+) synthetase [Pseudomonas kuykendallii]MCQ4271968.1 ammonia-dependent NAD(+) synthetase [Pseudomonas kuykendallii]SDX18947.1 NH(3)-dependent NAD(+) synthetase [Pseudomonas kuykendallii]